MWFHSFVRMDSATFSQAGVHRSPDVCAPEGELTDPAQALRSRPKTGRGSKPRVNVAERREAFLLAACRVFLDRGVGTATMQDVADAAGVPKILIYRIFPSKQALLDAIRDKVLAKIHEVWKEPNYFYGSRLYSMALAARAQPEPYLLVFRYSQAGVEALDWGAAVTSESWMQRQARARVSADAGTHACTLWAPARELADTRGT